VAVLDGKKLNPGVTMTGTINSGGIIAYPTEAVYGLGCRPDDFLAVKRVLQLKKRSMHKGLILVAADIEQIEPYVDYPTASVRERVLKSWPGPITWVLPATGMVPFWISGCHNSVAVRVSSHPAVNGLCRMVGVLVSTSANPEHGVPARSAMRVLTYYGNLVDYILPGKVGSQVRPTEIRDAIKNTVLRAGS